MRDLCKHLLNFESCLTYWNNFILSRIKKLEEESRNFTFMDGSFFTELPHYAYLDRIYDFTQSGIIPALPVIEEKIVLDNGSLFIPRCIFSTREEQKRMIFDFLQDDPHNKLTVYFENDRADCNSNYTLKKLGYDIFMKGSDEPFVGVLGKEKYSNSNSFKQDISRIFCTAYNGEAFINWESRNI